MLAVKMGLLNKLKSPAEKWRQRHRKKNLEEEKVCVSIFKSSLKRTLSFCTKLGNQWPFFTLLPSFFFHCTVSQNEFIYWIHSAGYIFTLLSGGWGGGVWRVRVCLVKKD